jgi:hypothetical protein
LLSKFANKDIGDLTSITPIHLCSFESAENLLKQLLFYGDDVNKTLESGKKDTPLHIADKRHDSKMVKILSILGLFNSFNIPVVNVKL